MKPIPFGFLAQAAAFDPLSLSPLLYARAEDIIGADGDSFASWTDRANSYDVTQSNAAKKPLVRTNQVNGFSGLQFDGIDDFLRNASVPSISDSTMFLVAKWPTAASDVPMWAGNTNTFSGRGLYGVSNSVAFTNYGASSVSPFVLAAEWQIYGFRQSGFDIRFFKGVSNSDDTCGGTIPTVGGFDVGGISAGNSNFASIITAEIFVKNSAMSDADCALLIAGWKAKFGL